MKMRVVGDQCKVRRNVNAMALGAKRRPVYQTDRQTDRDTRGQTGRQTGQVHGQHSVVWHLRKRSSPFVPPMEGSVDRRRLGPASAEGQGAPSFQSQQLPLAGKWRMAALRTDGGRGSCVSRSAGSRSEAPQICPTLTEDGRCVSWFNCFSAFSLSSRKNSAVARKNMPPRTMMKGQSMRAYPRLRNFHRVDVA